MNIKKLTNILEGSPTSPDVNAIPASTVVFKEYEIAIPV